MNEDDPGSQEGDSPRDLMVHEAGADFAIVMGGQPKT